MKITMKPKLGWKEHERFIIINNGSEFLEIRRKQIPKNVNLSDQHDIGNNMHVVDK